MILLTYSERLFVYLKDCYKEKSSICWVYSPSDCSGGSQGPGTPSWCPPWVAGPKHLGCPPLPSQVHLQGAGAEAGQLRPEPALQADRLPLQAAA